jgi:hypothetical protein
VPGSQPRFTLPDFFRRLVIVSSRARDVDNCVCIISAELFPQNIVQNTLNSCEKLSNGEHLRTINEKKVEARKIYCLQYVSLKTSLLRATIIMKLLSIHTVVVTALAALLSACGGQADSNPPLQTAALMQTVAVPGQQAAGGNPTPDCAPENCQGLRIIDGNAEAYRLDAQRRAAAEANGDPQA